MLTFFRRLINSRIGIVVALGLLLVIILGFALGDMAGVRNGLGGSSLSNDSVASVGDAKVSAVDLRKLAQIELDSARERQPTLDMGQFVSGGGLDMTLDRMIDTLALDQFGKQQGMMASQRLVDGQIASVPLFAGPDGKFSQTNYDQFLKRARRSDREVRDNVRSGLLAQQLVFPNSDLLDSRSGTAQVPAGLALPYASLLLEKRQGEIGFIPTPAVGKGAPPTEAELLDFYKRNRTRYTVPERRAVRYAVVSPDQVKASAAPSDAEIARAYQAQRAKFLPTEKRTIVQVVVADQAGATALAAKVKAGTPIEAAANAAGLAPNTLKDIEKSAYAAQNSPELANAAFGAAKGTVLGPLRSALGYVVLRVDNVALIPGKSLDQAKPELVAALTAEKTMVALTNIHDAIDDAISNHATFDEIVADRKLEAKMSPPLIAAGVNPDDPASKPDPAFAQALGAAFAAEQGDDPQIVPFGQDGGFGVVSLARIVPAAARRPSEIREVLTRDFLIDRAQRRARQVAVDVTARVNKGTPLAQAMAETKLGIPGPQPVPPISREQLSAAQGKVPPAIVLMFSMAEKRAKLLEAPNKAGWIIVYLGGIERGSAAGNTKLIDGTRAGLGTVVGREYVQQFNAAVRKALGVKMNASSIAEVKAALTGQGGSN